MFLPEGIQSMPPAQREAALTLTAITYADALVRGRINPKDLWEKYTIPRPSVDIARQLNEALEQERLVQWFDGLAQIGRAHACTPVTHAPLVCHLLLDKKHKHII